MDNLSTLLYLALVLLMLFGPFILGGYLAKVLRMPDYSWKIGLILFTFIVSVSMITIKWPPKLGIDLSGGVILIYEIDRDQLQRENKDPESVDMDKLLAAIKLRVNPGGQKEVTIRQYGRYEIEIIIPSVLGPEKDSIKEIISKTGKLEFRIVANTNKHKKEIALAKSDPEKTVWKDSNDEWIARWVPVKDQEKDKFNTRNLVRTVKRGGKDVTEVLVVNDVYNVTGDYLANARAGFEMANPIVLFNFNTKGGQLFGRLTNDNLPDPVTDLKNQLAIILDGTLYSAPNIITTITESGQITGTFTQKEVDDVVEVLNAGSLPAALAKTPVQELTSGATLGEDTIRKSTYAMIISALLVVGFMVVYYRFSGVLAVIALALNILGIVAVMITFKAAFTLTGFAALALTVGMAVDNNVLVYERMREELAKGAALRMAIRNAFNRAGTTIIDCNMTHVIVAIVLWTMGSDQIKGFAITLLLGVAFSMFTAVFVSHVFFDIAERHHWITKLKMMHIIGHTSIDFMGVFPICLAFSIIITMLGLGAAYFRGVGLFDIDFTGGVSVQILFNKDKPHTAEDVRAALNDEKEMPDLAIYEVRLGDEPQGLRFDVNTSRGKEQSDKEEAQSLVKKFIQQKFAGDLSRNGLTVKDLGTAIPAKPGPSTPAKEEIKLQTPAEPEKTPAKSDVNPKGDQPPKEKSSPAKQSNYHRRSANWLAVVAAAPLFFAQVDALPAQPPADVPAAEKSVTDKAADGMPADSNPNGAKPADTQPVDTKPADVKPADTKLADTKPADTKPADTKTADTKPADTKPAENKPADAKSTAAPVEDSSTLGALTDPFRGGSQAELHFAMEVDHSQVEAILKNAMTDLNLAAENVRMDITGVGYREGDADSRRLQLDVWNVKLSVPPEEARKVFDAAEKKLTSEPYFPASNAIGSAVAGSTRLQAIWALIASWALIILYLWIRFQGVAFGLAAVVALIHDVLVMLGGLAFSYWLANIPGFREYLLLEPFKINLPIIAAFLTIIGYSVNDTIVVFDRIREIRGKDPYLTRKMVNDATNQTLSRTLITSLTVFIVVVVLYWCGGPALRGFSFALSIGVVTGTYSSIYVAAPILLWLVGKHKVSAEHPHYEPPKP